MNGLGAGAGEDPGVLRPAAARGVHDQLALLERDPGEPARQHPYALAVVHGERSQVDVARRHRAIDVRRHGGELDHGLGDPGPRVLRDPAAQIVELGAVRLGPDDDALATRAVDRLDDQLVEAVHHLLAGVRVTEAPGVDVLEDRLLREVVADQVGDIGVDELVVGYAVADRVGERHLAAARGVDQAGAAEQRVTAEVHRVEELVVDAAVDDVHRLEAVGGAHHDPAATALQVASLDELDAHRARQQGVLEVGAVVDARRQHDDRRVGDAGRGRGPQRGEESLRVARDRPDPVVREGLRQRCGDRAAVRHDVRDP